VLKAGPYVGTVAPPSARPARRQQRDGSPDQALAIFALVKSAEDDDRPLLVAGRSRTSSRGSAGGEVSAVRTGGAVGVEALVYAVGDG
jgi:hypothetical protein